jgi:hypothetical protein
MAWPQDIVQFPCKIKSNTKIHGSEKNKAVFFRPALLDSFHWFISNEGQTLKN